jgi:KDO2-lipid IV(A) lauroyltransferase
MLRLLTWAACLLPQRWVRRLGRVLGWLTCHVFRVRRRVVRQNLAAAMRLDAVEARRLTRGIYDHLCTGAIEFLRVAALDREEALEVLGGEGVRRLKAHLGDGRGMLVLSAHLGNWDLLACAAARCGLPVNVVTRRIKTGWLDRYWMRARERCGVSLLPDSGSARRVVAALRRGEAVAMVLDQHQPGGTAVPFFGRPAATATSLARLALATGAPVVPVFLVRDGLRFRLRVHDPVQLVRTGRRSTDIIRNTALFVQTLEQEIARYPEQWLWLHRRWKIRRSPEGVAADGVSDVRRSHT